MSPKLTMKYWTPRKKKFKVGDQKKYLTKLITMANPQSVCWVLKQKLVDEKWSTKARSCAWGFKEIESFKTESPSCSKESVHVAITLIASNKWILSAINIKTAFLQGKKIDRMIIKPPREGPTNKLLKLSKCVYGLPDAPRCWHLILKKELFKLNVTGRISITQVYSTTSKMANYKDWWCVL